MGLLLKNHGRNQFVSHFEEAASQGHLESQIEMFMLSFNNMPKSESLSLCAFCLPDASAQQQYDAWKWFTLLIQNNRNPVKMFIQQLLMNCITTDEITVYSIENLIDKIFSILNKLQDQNLQLQVFDAFKLVVTSTEIPQTRSALTKLSFIQISMRTVARGTFYVNS